MKKIVSSCFNYMRNYTFSVENWLNRAEWFLGFEMECSICHLNKNPIKQDIADDYVIVSCETFFISSGLAKNLPLE